MKPQLILMGLGNPGNTHARTRHNVGFQVIDRLCEEFGEGEWKPAQKFLSETLEGRIVTVPILLVKPQTYMNRSGEAAKKLMDFYKLAPDRLFAFVDDVDLPVGTIRYREKGGPGTHNGLRSIVEILGEGFPRIRVGVGPQPKGVDLGAWILSVPPAAEKKKIKDAIEEIPSKVRDFVLSEG